MSIVPTVAHTIAVTKSAMISQVIARPIGEGGGLLDFQYGGQELRFPGA